MTRTAPPSAETPEHQPGAWRWPLIVVTLLAGHLTICCVTIYLATSDPSFAVEPDYYNKALHWDEFNRQRYANAALGWKLDYQVDKQADVLRQRSLRCTLVDQAGQPIRDAAISLVAFPHRYGTRRQTVELTATDEGDYAATLRFGTLGLWEFRFTVKRAGQTFTYTDQRFVTAAKKPS